jgi:uncharacterized phiE125 gp8 family phage protein
MIGNLRLITPPAIEPVTVDDVKLSTRVSYDAEDSLLQLWISSARELAEDFQHRAFITQEWELSFDTFPKLPVELYRPPVQEIVSFKLYDYQNNEIEIPLSDLLVDTDSLMPRVTLARGVSFPSVQLRELDAVKVRYKAGFGDTCCNVPRNVIDAILLYCSYRYENRTAEVEKVPQHFYDLLRPDRVHL